MARFPSPNFGPRRDGARPELIVIHYTAMASCAEARERLCDPVAEVSAHWLIDEDGRAEQLVDEGLRAWHAGAGSWRGRGDVNSRSIGIELANPGDRPFAEAQMAALERLLAAIMQRWGIPAEGVIGHSDMAPGRKADPGPRFDWRRLALAGLAAWPFAAEREEGGCPPPAPDGAPPEDISATEMARFLAALARLGYPEAEAAVLLAAFRLRFRPWGRGAGGRAELARAEALAARIAVDGDGGGA